MGWQEYGKRNIALFDSSAYQPDAANDDEPRWVTAYHDALNAVRTAGKGSRNPTLNAQAFIIGRIVAAGHVKEKDAQADLEGAAADAGIMHGDERAKSIDTIKRGLAAGAKNPWEENGAGAARNATVVSRETGTVPVSRDRNGPNDTRSPAMKDISPEAATGEPITKAERARIELAIHNYERAKPAVDTIGQKYLMGRGINILPAECRWDGSALVLPLIDSHGKVTALHRIPINKDLSRGQKVTQGKMSDGVFKIAATDPECNIWVVTDGPEDALTCAEATGWHAAAVCGKARMYHIAAHVPHGATVVLCRDADEEAGPAYDRALRALCNHLCTGIIADPPDGLQTDRFEQVKDANDIAQHHGTEKVREWLIGVLARDRFSPVHVGATDAWVSDDLPDATDDEADEAEETAAVSRLPRPSGLLAYLLDHIVASGMHPQPELALGAAMTVVGAAMGRRYAFRGARPNLFVVGVAPSASGKNHVLDSVKRTLVDCDLVQVLAGKEPASGSAVVSRIMDNPVSVYCSDEIGMMLRAANDPRAPTHVKDVIKVWTELYTASGSMFFDKDRADRRAAPTRIVHQPHLGIFGVTAGTHLWKSLTVDGMQDGSIARFLFIESAESYPDPNFETATAKTPDHIKDAIAEVVRHGGGGGNLGAQAAFMADAVDVREVGQGVGVADAIRAAIIAETENKRAHERDGLSSVFGRRVEISLKLAMIHAVGRDPEAACVCMQDWTWAMETAGMLIDRLVVNITASVAKNEHERLILDTLKIIKDAGKRGISGRDLTRKTQWLKGSDRKDVLEALIASGRVTATVKKTNGRAATLFSYVN